jgi:hypothetical protein
LEVPEEGEVHPLEYFGYSDASPEGVGFKWARNLVLLKYSYSEQKLIKNLFEGNPKIWECNLGTGIVLFRYWRGDAMFLL